MAIKVDLEKANDRLQWGFILETLNLCRYSKLLDRTDYI